MANSLHRRRRAALPRPVITPVRRPAVTARVRPWPSCASNVLLSSAEPSDCDSNVTLPSVSVPSTSMSSTRICLARFASFLGIFFPRLANCVSSILLCVLCELCVEIPFEFNSLHQFQGPQIMQMHHAEHASCFVHHNNGSDLALFHQI